MDHKNRSALAQSFLPLSSVTALTILLVALLFAGTAVNAQTVSFSGAVGPIVSFSTAVSRIAVDGAGEVFAVRNTGSTKSLIKVDAAGGVTVLNSNFPFTPDAIAVNQAGDTLYFIHQGAPWPLPGGGGSNTVYIAKTTASSGFVPWDLPCTFNPGWSTSYASPTDLKVDSSGDLYIADFGAPMFWKIPSGGTVPTQFLMLPNGVQPWDFAIANGKVYFTYPNFSDSMNPVLGSVPAAFGTSFSVPTGTLVATGLTSLNSGLMADPSGNILVGGTSGISKLSGGTLTPVPGYSSSSVASFGIDSAGKIFTGNGSTISTLSYTSAVVGSKRVGTTTVLPLQFKFGTGGKLGGISVLNQGASGLDFTAAGSGTCNTTVTYAANDTCTVDVTFLPAYVGLRRGAVILKNTSGDILSTVLVYGTGTGPQIAFSPAVETVIGSGMSGVTGVAIDSAGTVYIADLNNNRVVKETLSGGSYIQTVVADSITNGLSSPTGVAVDGAGNVYIADSANNRILKETLSGSGYTQSVVADSVTNGLSLPSGVAVDGAGNVYIADTLNSRVLKEALSGSGYIQAIVADHATNGLNGPLGVAVDAAGNLYIADTASSRVLKETLSGGSYTQTVVADSTTNGLAGPSGVAVDGAGNVYIADTSNNRVLKETLSGGTYTQSVLADGTNGLSAPYGVAVGGNGNVYTADYNHSRVLKQNLADPPSLSFATTSVGTPSSDGTKTITIRNVGTSSLTFVKPSSGYNPTIGPDFTLGGSCPQLSPSSTAFTLAVGGSCTYDIGFTPTTSGSLSEALVLTENAFPTTQMIAVSGVALAQTVSLTVAPSVSTVNQSVTMSVTVTGSSGTPTGNVVFLANGSALSDCGGATGLPLNGVGTVMCSTSTLQPSVTQVSAQYLGDPTYAAMSSNQVSVTVAALTPIVAISSSPASPAAVNTNVTFTATLTGVTLTPVAPSGTVRFAADGTTIPGCAVGMINSAGSATCSTSLTAGVHTITATYSGDTNYVAAAPGSISYTVNALQTTVSLTPSPVSPSALNTNVTFTAALTGVPLTPVTPSGTITFAANGTTVASCTQTISAAGVATCTMSSLQLGNNTVTATYSGDSNYVAAAPGSANYTVTALHPTVTISATPASSSVNAPVTLTAGLTGVTLTPITPSGSVTFAANGTTITGCGAVAVSAAGVATCSTTSLNAGSHAITATYSADANFVASSPGSTAYTVAALTPAVTVTASPSGSSVLGSNATFTAALTGVLLTPVTPAGTVTFAASGTTITGCAAVAVNAAGVATCSTTSLNAGSHAITATYSADANFVASAPGSTSYAVVAPPSIAKAFSPATIALNATTSLTFTITNPAANTVALTGVTFIDALPTGLTVANASATVCGGTLTTTAPTGIALSGATIAVNSQCQFSVTVTGAASGQYTNTSGSITSTNGGTGNTATASLTVAAPPAITSAFGSSQIPLNGTASLTLNITNPNTNIALTGVAFTDSLPAGVVVASTPNLNSTCGGTATAAAGSGTVSLAAGTLASTRSCTVTVSVQGTAAGVKNNSLQVTSAEGGTGNTSNATITVVAPPAITKAFAAATIPLNGSTTLSFTIDNPNTTTALTAVAFTDTLPAGLVISTPNALTGTCGGGTITATQGTGVISLSAGSLAASGSCSFSVDVTGTTAGTKNNTTGSITSTEGGTGGTASASIVVVAPPVIAKAFNPTAVLPGTSVTLSFTITNPAVNTVALTGVAFTDVLPSTLTLVGGSSSVCGGTLVRGDYFPDPNVISLSGASIAPNGSCQFSVVLGTTQAGQFSNTTSAVTSTNGGTGNTASASLIAAFPPVIVKAFGAATIPLNGATSLTFTLTNAALNLTPVNGVAFNDVLPAGLVVATPNNLSNTCGGTVVAANGSGAVSLSGTTLAVNGTCTISLDVQGTTAGTKNNTTGPISSTESGPGATSNTATLTVLAPPVITKSFGAASITLGGTTSLTLSISNPNPGYGLTGVAVSDSLPAGLVIATPNGLTGTCGGGTITAVAGANSLSLTGATLAAGGSCTFSVNVLGIHAGTQVNTTGSVSSLEGGAGATATASLTVNQASTTTTLVSAGTKHFGEAATFTATVSSAAWTPTGTVAFLDGTTTLGTATLNSGVATFSTTGLALGTHSITASYQGSSDYLGSVSTAVSQEVIVPLLTMSAGSNTLQIKAGEAGVTQLTIGSAGTLSAPVTFSCSGLPTGSECVFSPASVGPGSLPAQTTLSITTTRLRIVGQNIPSTLPWTFAMLVPGVCLWPLAGKGGRRRWLSVALGLALLLMLMLSVGCGGSANSSITNVQQSTSPGTYTVVVTASSTGATQTSTNFNVIVTP